MKNEVNVTVGGAFFVFWLCIVFWDQSGWYRVDCSLKIEKACGLIAAEYAAKAKP